MKSKLLLILWMIIWNSYPSWGKETTTLLQLNEVISAEIRVGDQHDYALPLEHSELVFIRLERGSFELGKEVNLLITIYDPANQIVEEVNTANDASLAIFVAEMTGRHKVVVRRWNGAANGNYKIKLELQEKKEKAALAQIDRILNHLYDAEKPGAVVAIIQNEEPIYKKCFGQANLAYNSLITEDTPFELASLSKKITGFAVAMLIDQGKLATTDPLTKFIPEFPIFGKEVTIHHLVHNLSGIKDYEPALALAGYTNDNYDRLSKERILRAILAQDTPYFQPGTNYRYSNSGYVLLSEIVSRVVGMPFEKWVKENIFQPLEMNDTYISHFDRNVVWNQTVSYKKETGGYDDIQATKTDYKVQPKNLGSIGGAHVQSTLNDMIKWANNYKTGKVGGANVLKIIEQGIIPEAQPWDWYYGFQRYHYKGLERRASEGLTQGYRSFYSRFPAQEVSFIFLTNDGEWRTYYVAKKIIDVFLKDQLEKEKIESAYNPQNDQLDALNSIESPELEQHLTEFEGNYFHEKLQTIYTVNLEAQQLVAKSIGFQPIKLRSTIEDTFVSDFWFFNKIIFERDQNERVVSCKIYNSQDGAYFLLKKI